MLDMSVTLNKNWWADFQLSPLQEPALRRKVLPYMLGIIKQSDDVTERTFDPQSRPLMDNPKGVTKGHTYIVPLAWMGYMMKLMTATAFGWWLKPWMLMVNRRHKYDGIYPPDDDECRFENISLPCNFIAFDQMTATHGRVVGRMTNFDVSTLDPLVNNWFNEPHLFWMASMHNVPEKQVFRVGKGLHVFTPVIRQLPEQWAHLSTIELFPKLPMVVTYEGEAELITGYCLEGASVYGHAETRDVPLRLARTTGELIHPCPEWRLDEKPVPV